MEKVKQSRGIVNWIRTSVTARMFMIGFLILVLIIPLTFVKDLIRERADRQQDVVAEVGKLWGEEVLLEGPILRVPYKTYTESTRFDAKLNRSSIERTTHIKYAYFFPELLHLDVNVDALKKERGIYETSVFSSQIQMKGRFDIPNFKQQDIEEKDVLWEKATILMKSSNLKGVKNQIEMKIGNDSTSFLPKYKQQDNAIYDPYYLPMHQLESPFLSEGSVPKESHVEFSTSLVINGSARIRFVPIGKETLLHMESNWADPSFTGSFLPEEDEEKNVDASGFVANWKILQTNRQFEQAFFGTLPDLKDFSFGTELLVPVDEYQKSERTAKYGYLVISLTFLVFFLIQAISKISIHPFQYLLIGLALVMFYTLLISISEHQSFLKAYLISGSAVILTITLYSRSILKNLRFAGLVFTSLLALYSFIFVIIQLENYALLVGSIGLFVILALIMFASRKIDWSN